MCLFDRRHLDWHSVFVDRYLVGQLGFAVTKLDWHSVFVDWHLVGQLGFAVTKLDWHSVFVDWHLVGQLRVEEVKLVGQLVGRRQLFAAKNYLGFLGVGGTEHSVAIFDHVVAENRVVDDLPLGVFGSVILKALGPLVFDVLLDLLFGHADLFELDLLVGFCDCQHLAGKNCLGFLRCFCAPHNLAVFDHVVADEVGLSAGLPLAGRRASIDVELVRYFPAANKLSLVLLDAGEASILGQLIWQHLLGFVGCGCAPHNLAVFDHVVANEVGLSAHLPLAGCGAGLFGVLVGNPPAVDQLVPVFIGIGEAAVLGRLVAILRLGIRS